VPWTVNGQIDVVTQTGQLGLHQVNITVHAMSTNYLRLAGEKLLALLETKRHGMRDVVYAAARLEGKEIGATYEWTPSWDETRTVRIARAVSYWRQAEAAQRELRAAFGQAKLALDELAGKWVGSPDSQVAGALIDKLRKTFKLGDKSFPQFMIALGPTYHHMVYGRPPLEIQAIEAAEMDLKSAQLECSTFPRFSDVKDLQRRVRILARVANHRCVAWTDHGDGQVSEPCEAFLTRGGERAVKNMTAWHAHGRQALQLVKERDGRTDMTDRQTIAI
jgi:hypothetical protein